MDRLKKARTPIRSQLTRLSNQVQPMLITDPPDLEALRVKSEQLEAIRIALQEADEKIKDQLLDDDAPENDIEDEYQATEQYQETYIILKNQIKKLINPTVSPTASEVYQSVGSEARGNDKKRNFKLPKITLMKFNGELNQWLAWWSQFRKIDEDDDLDDSDKFQYLYQSMQPDTEAMEIVKSYPHSAENYSKAIEALQERFGRDDLQLQFYVRELLTLVISNVAKKEKLALSSLYLKLESHLRCLATLKLDQADPATWLFPLVESSLAEETLRAWQRSPISKQDGTQLNPQKTRLDLLMEFIRNEVRTEQQISMAQNAFQSTTLEGQPKKPGKSKASIFRKGTDEQLATAAGLIVGEVICAFCDGKHQSDRCVRGQAMAYAEKKEKVEQKRLCFRCLMPGHPAKRCKLVVRCILCSGKHYPIMCQGERSNDKKENPVSAADSTQQKHTNFYDGNSGYPSNQSPSYPPPPGGYSSSSASSNQCSGDVILNTLLVKVVGENSSLIVRLVGDTGSQRSYIRKDIVKQIKCARVGQEWIQNVLFGGGVTPPMCTDKFGVWLGHPCGQFCNQFLLLERPQICGSLPKIPNGPWLQELREQGIQLSDVGVGCSEVDILIGSDYWGSLLTGEVFKLKCGLVAVNTMFGWALSGRVPVVASNLAVPVMSMLATTNDLSSLWSLEALGINDPIEVVTREEDERRALSHFKETVTRDESGRYVVSLPWKHESVPLPTYRSVAERCLNRTTVSLKKKDNFQLYDDVFKQWENEGYIARVENDDGKGYYLPHHPVFKESTTTPCRPVFNASCKSGKLPSLNDCLYKGPNLLELIPTLLLSFREKEIGISADIRKAFQMLSVREEDQKFQKFLWWEDQSCQRIQVFKHLRVVFGMNCSPFLLAATIKHHLSSVDNQEFAEKLLNSFYVDNVVTSVSSHQEFEDFREKATAIMKSAGMELRQWASSFAIKNGVNTPTDAMCMLGPEVEAKPEEVGTCLSVLGVIWDRIQDSLSCVIPEFEFGKGITKRSLLSAIARIFDPIGFTAPALLPVKIIIQDSWIRNVGWDEELPPDYQKQVEKWVKAVSVLGTIQIPRNFQLSGTEKREIHVFVDASSHAYACVVFLRSSTRNKVEVQLLLAKSRLSPAKRIASKSTPARPTIPRLELMACVIGTRIATIARQSIEYQHIPFQFWSDSTTALAWIRRNEQWGTFVGNRVSEILKSTSPSQWRHVPGCLNPADLPSRGCSPLELVRSRWWEGPSWLKEEKAAWPNPHEETDENTVASERRKVSALLATQVLDQPRFSSYRKNVSVMAWVLRFVKSCKREVNASKSSYISVPEMREAERIVIRKIQSEAFQQQSRRIGGMMVFQDESRLLRVMTRLTNRKDAMDFTYPIILPKKHPLVNQLIFEVHRFHGHAGVQFLMSKLREKYWVLQSRRTIKRVIRSCTVCRRHQAKPLDVSPAPLPRRRVSNSEPFETTGVDLAGPFFLKDGSKSWVVLFTCAYYRCLYMDLVNSLSTETFLGAMERFVSLYGRPNTVYSDNGTNFHGAVNLFKQLDWRKIESESNVRQINWVFNPPTAAWWGGWWERLVRSVKDLMKRILGRSRLNYDQLRTCIMGVSATINDRPLTVVSEDSGDLIPLTPSMFIRRQVDGGMPETASCESLQRGFIKMKNLQRQLKDRFRKEYVSLLVQRRNEAKNNEIAVGDIVMVGADNKKRFQWPLGLVLELIPGGDGEHRVAKIKTANGVLIRPFQRLYPLEFSSKDKDELKESNRLEKAVKARKLPRNTPTTKKSESVVITKRGRVVIQPSRYGQWFNLVSS
ncbi:unnamed protein product [Orchesella dallaii]|uniref:Integrase catalytic domain-containing protein n=1 Tax=Orchesella dallaii TaxID=48710 RepID=A0ABP1RG58_9HEXA